MKTVPSTISTLYPSGRASSRSARTARRAWSRRRSWPSRSCLRGRSSWRSSPAALRTSAAARYNDTHGDRETRESRQRPAMSGCRRHPHPEPVPRDPADGHGHVLHLRPSPDRQFPPPGPPRLHRGRRAPTGVLPDAGRGSMGRALGERTYAPRSPGLRRVRTGRTDGQPDGDGVFGAKLMWGSHTELADRLGSCTPNSPETNCGCWSGSSGSRSGSTATPSPASCELPRRTTRVGTTGSSPTASTPTASAAKSQPPTPEPSPGMPSPTWASPCRTATPGHPRPSAPGGSPQRGVGRPVSLEVAGRLPIVLVLFRALALVAVLTPHPHA